MGVVPKLKNFRTATTPDGILHLVFDMPGRSMNVFTNAAIHEIGTFASWLKTSDVIGVVVSSGKPGAFCAGADLSELSTAYDMIMASPLADRDALTVEHFSPIGRAFRQLETAGKPVAVAIHGVALGGGCELALACHYRVLTDAKETQIGLPESLVGLLPGGGGTQRLPRFVGVAASLPVLIQGARFDAEQALAAGVAHEVVEPGGEIAAAEAWVRRKPVPIQPWDKPNWTTTTGADVHAVTGPVRETLLRESGGHFPAEIAILDCLDRGLPKSMDEGIAEEIDIFKDLVQRIEPRNMIAVMFLGRVEYDKRRRKGTLPDGLQKFGEAVKAAMEAKAASLGTIGDEAIAFAGIYGKTQGDSASANAVARRKPQWFAAPRDAAERAALAILASGALVAAREGAGFAEDARQLVDFHCQKSAGFPRYLGGPFTFLNHQGEAECRKLAGA